MLRSYLASLLITVLVLSYGISLAPFVTHGAVLAGRSIDEDRTFEFTVDVGRHQVYAVDGELAGLLKEGVRLRTDGVVRITSSEVSVTPQEVSWKEGRTRYTADGAAMHVKLHWDTPADSANGARSHIYVDFSGITELGSNTISMHSGGYDAQGGNNFAIREAQSYTSPLQLAVAQLYLAMTVGLPAGIVLHALAWYFLVLMREKKARIAALPADAPGTPRTFHANPLAEWENGLWLLGLVSLFAGAIALVAALEGNVNHSFALVPYVLVAIGLLLVPVALFYTRRNILTFQVGQEGVAYARGRESQNWTHIPWSNIDKLQEKSNRYGRWLEIRQKGQWLSLKVKKNAVADYPGLLTALKVS
jgi:hypothetical protein